MFHASRTDSPPRSLASGAWAPMVLAAAMTLLAASGAHAQLVPFQEHAWRQHNAADAYTNVRISLKQATGGTDARSQGLSLRDAGSWPRWEGRVGVTMDRPVNPLKDSFVLAQPNQGAGSHVRSMHILSDYYVDGGFRATAGLLRGDNGQAWWASEGQGGGLNLSLQRLDTLGALLMPSSEQQTTAPYLGAGYSNTLKDGLGSGWRFNADLGFVGTSSGNLGHLGQALQGDRGMDDIVRELRLRPVVKISVGYSF